jgi:hypothetical protein
VTTTRAQTVCPECLSGSWLAERFAVDPSQIEAMRRAGELVAVREPGAAEWRYPAWQLDGTTPRPVILRIVAVAREVGLDEASLYETLTAPLGLRGTRRLVDLIEEGRDEEVVAAVRAAG